MWRPATREVSGTNDAEETAPPQLAQPSPSAYPRQAPQDHDSGRRGRDDSSAEAPVVITEFTLIITSILTLTLTLKLTLTSCA
ncbi:hypothetical protein BJ138DRAFT_932926 [Hygrophoropsis aurantiaca]|uniref:Uncharacterized protein n=1 Tax=Hygrophoropsis aurantiaca TaxID=72124 RepID=A0ACB8ADQ9_9AGAM|nr:hypothetical protein BJ138DRAFT_932926 [Hygrophoropsis aurantiaca]